MRILVCLAALALAAAAPAPRSAPAPECANPRLTQADISKSGKFVAVKSRANADRLIDLPPGNLYLTVQRHVDNCVVPAIVRTGIGGNPARPRKP